MKRSVDDKRSRYTQGGLTDTYPTRLGWWSRYPMIRDSITDYEYTIPNKYHLNPHAMAYDFYGSADYFFIILQYNNILDVNEEFIAGKMLILPTRSRIVEFLGKRTGGLAI